jgi:2-iminobutanoate/2-iminopropanoate deaminase
MNKLMPVTTAKSFAALGPYSQAVRTGNMIFCSGNLGIELMSNALITGGIKTQTRQTLQNIREILRAAGADLNQVVKTTVYLKNMNDFSEMNEVYASFFHEPYPARATVQVTRLPKDALIEIECIAVT